MATRRGEQMMKRKALEKKMGAIDNSHSPQEWTAPSTPQKITVPFDATVAAALRDVGFTVQRSRSTQSSRLDSFGSAKEVRAEVA